jgi:hypothetical protein
VALKFVAAEGALGFALRESGSDRCSDRRRHGRKTLVGVHEGRGFPAALQTCARRAADHGYSGASINRGLGYAVARPCSLRTKADVLNLAVGPGRPNMLKPVSARLPRTPLVGEP